ncbi:phosphoribosyltransferase family protein [Streptomyces sp. NPDC003077]|uniref:ComF family protein n=1 Tax=Streptomyces sp. NPDC003077 TaxID=3154443 RepID=UPI0033B00E91
MTGMWREIVGLALPVGCAGCGRPRTELCAECRGAVIGNGSVRRVGPRRVRPRPPPVGLPTVYAAAPYADAVRAVVLAHKERGALALAGPLGVALARAVRELRPGGGPPVLVPVPSARRAVARRGHDPVRRVALAATRELRRTGPGGRVLAVLRQRRKVADQAGLGAEERRVNLAGALEVPAGRARLLTAPVVLVDDLVTTGATLAEAARAVEAAGGRVAGAAVVAAPRSAADFNWN